MAAHQAPLSLGFSRQEHWSGMPFPSPMHESEKRKGSHSGKSCPTLRDPMDCSLPGSSIHGIFQARVLEWGAIAFSIVDPKEYQRLFQGVCEVKNIFTILLQHHLLFTLCWHLCWSTQKHWWVKLLGFSKNQQKHQTVSSLPCMLISECLTCTLGEMRWSASV